MSSWPATTIANVYTLSSANRPATDLGGGVLGRDPTARPGATVVSPMLSADPAFANLGPGSAPYGKWGTSSAAAPVTLTYSFYEVGGPAIVGGAAIQPMPLDAGHRDAVRSALAAYANVANLTFVEVLETADTIGHLRFIDDKSLDNNAFAEAYTKMPASNLVPSGLVALDVDRGGVIDNLARGGNVYATIVHEAGHALGLSHPFDGADTPPAAGDIRGTDGVWNKAWTAMAYLQPGSALKVDGDEVNPVGPMIGDVYVLQSYYGANRTTNAGNDTYQVDGRFPKAAIWDAGGTDTLDASAATLADGTSGLVLDLTPGQVGPHVAIAFGASIENVIGSAGNDTITGTNPGTLAAGDGTTTTTDGNNWLNGGAGNDTIFGLGGDDVLIGGSGINLLDGGDGNDTASFAVATSAATVSRDGADLIITTATSTDRLRNIETLAFTDRNITAADATTILAPTSASTPAAPPSTPAAEPVIDPARKLAITADGTSRVLAMDDYTGPVQGLKFQHIGNAASEAMRGTDSNDFLHGMGGDDAIDGGQGDDVLDGGVGSNFLTGGSGADTFFVDGRSAGVTWSTVTDLDKGELVTAWGWHQGTSKLTWAEMTGADGYKGATAHIDLDGNGSVDMSMTIAGKTSGAIVTMTGTVGADTYLAFTLR